MQFVAALSIMILATDWSVMAAPPGPAPGPKGPCDIYAAASTPCVAAHSMARALYAEYTGPLYELHRISDNTTKQIGVKPGTGFADAGAQTAFCPPSTKVRLRSTCARTDYK